VATAVAVIGFILTSVIGYVMQTMMFDPMPMSRNAFARSSTTLDVVYWAYRIITVALLQFCLASENMLWFCVWNACASLAVAVCYVYCLPYYRRGQNQLRISALLLSTLFSVFSATTYNSLMRSNFQSNSHADVTIILVTSPLVFAFCFR